MVSLPDESLRKATNQIRRIVGSVEYIIVFLLTTRNLIGLGDGNHLEFTLFALSSSGLYTLFGIKMEFLGDGCRIQFIFLEAKTLGLAHSRNSLVKYLKSAYFRFRKSRT
jgi:hypothetical protein